LNAESAEKTIQKYNQKDERTLNEKNQNCISNFGFSFYIAFCITFRTSSALSANPLRPLRSKNFFGLKSRKTPINRDQPFYAHAP
jgi:hypothetical protein